MKKRVLGIAAVLFLAAGATLYATNNDNCCDNCTTECCSGVDCCADGCTCC